MSASATDHLEVRWRIKDSDERWCQPVRCAAMSEIVVEKLPHDKQYEFEVRAVSDCGAKSIWVAADYTVPTAAAPTGTPSLTAQSIADGVHLGWTLPIDQPGIWWIVERASAATGPFTQRARVNSTAYTDPETSGSAFFYRVHAENWFGGAGPYSNVVSSQGVSVDALGDDVAAAQAAAAAAQSDATDALDQLTDIGSDDVLSPVEKSVVIRDYAVIQTEQDGIDAQADAYGITTAKSAYDSAISALTTYLGTLTEPVAWDDTSGNTTIVGTTFRSKFNAIYDARQTLLNAIYAAAKQAAADAETAANTYTDAQLTSYVQATVYSQQVAGLQSQIDGQIDSFFGQVDPTTANDPASGWDAAEKQRHKGDTYTNLWNGTAAGGSGTPGGSWRWAYDGTNYYWQVIGDTATQKALAMAGAAQDTADGKRRNFITTPAPPYDTGDTWTQGGTVKVCTTSKVFGGSFSSDDWRRAGDVTADNTAKNTSSISGAVNASVDLGGANYNTGTIGWVWKYLPAAQGLVDGGYLDASYRLTHYYGADNKLYRIRALASLDKANLDSNIEDGTTYRRVGSGYVDTSHRISGIYDGTLGAIRDGSYLGTGASRAWSGLDANGLLADQKTPLTRLSGRTLDHIADTATFARVHTSNLAGNSIDLAKPSIAHRSLEYIADQANRYRTALYGDETFSVFTVNVLKLETAGQGHVLGDLRNQQTIGYGSYGSVFSDLTVGYTASTNASGYSTATITFTGTQTLHMGNRTASYNIGDITVHKQLYGVTSYGQTTYGAQSVKYYVYLDDPTAAGGSISATASTAPSDQLDNLGRVAVAEVDVTFPSASNSSGGTGSGGGIGACVAATQWVVIKRKEKPVGIHAGSLKVGDLLRIVDPHVPGFQWHPVEFVSNVTQPCVAVTMPDGTSLVCSNHAPLSDHLSNVVCANAAAGKGLMGANDEVVQRLQNAQVESAGMQETVLVTCGDNWFPAGNERGKYLLHHNKAPAVPAAR